MRFLLVNHIQNARQSLHANRIRSLLTMIGVMIGIASISTVFAISDGALYEINKQVVELNDNLILVRPGKSTDLITNLGNTHPNHRYATSTLLESDISKIKEIEGVKSVAPIMIMSGTIHGDNNAPSFSQVLATSTDLININKFGIKSGQFLDKDESKNTAVIGIQLSINIFGTEDSIGRTAIVKGRQLLIVGVLDRIKDSVNYNSVDFNNAILVNYKIGKEINYNHPQIQQINIAASSSNKVDEISEKIYSSVKKNHLEEDDFSVLTKHQIAEPTNELFEIVTSLSITIATISLVVGGIGIMNIMLVTVAERTREIGIRKALGANNNDILNQFLIESILISTTGGILGLILGYIISFIVSTFSFFNPVITWESSLIAFIASLVVGISFGIYPACRAARKDPIESLHQYH